MVRVDLPNKHNPKCIILLNFSTNRVINACVITNYKGLEMGPENRFHEGITIIPNILTEFKK